jgi:hypothetical protein
LRFERRLQRSQLVGIHQLFSGVGIENLGATPINTGLQPGATDWMKNKPFQRFTCEKAIKTAYSLGYLYTRLKPGVNESSKPDDPIAATSFSVNFARSAVGVRRVFASLSDL